MHVVFFFKTVAATRTQPSVLLAVSLESTFDGAKLLARPFFKRLWSPRSLTYVQLEVNYKVVLSLEAA